MTHRLVGMVFAIIVAGQLVGNDPVSFPKDVPPVLGMAVVSDAGGSDALDWTINLTVPKVAWQVVGEVVPKQQWPELEAEVERATLTLQMGGPSALAPSQVVDLTGKELRRDQVVKRLEKLTPVLVSVSGRMPDPYFLQLTKPGALIVILGARDGVPAPELLPTGKAPLAQ